MWFWRTMIWLFKEKSDSDREGDGEGDGEGEEDGDREGKEDDDGNGDDNGEKDINSEDNDDDVGGLYGKIKGMAKKGACILLDWRERCHRMAENSKKWSYNIIAYYAGKYLFTC